MLWFRARSLFAAALAFAAMSLPAVPPSAATAADTTPVVAAPRPADQPGAVRIGQIQGPGRTSPMLGERVVGVGGVVTAVQAAESDNGFWFQAETQDRDPRTSEALFVCTAEEPVTLSPGDTVTVQAEVTMFQAAEGTQPVTALSDASWSVLSTGNALPPAVPIGPGIVPTEYAAASTAPPARDHALAPDTYALDFWASLEHMRVRVENVRVVAPLSSRGSFWVTVEPERFPTARGGALAPLDGTPHTGLLRIDPLPAAGAVPDLAVGDVLTGVTEGPLSYTEHGGYTMRATALGERVDGGLEPVHAPPGAEWELSIGTYNLANLSPQVDAVRVDGHAQHVVSALGSPDILGLQEVQDSDGPDDTGTVDAVATLERFVAAIGAAGGPEYDWRQIDPQDGRDGGQPGGNIRNVLLFRPDRVEFVDRGTPTPTSPVEVVTYAPGRAALHPSPARIDPSAPAWQDSRKPLVGEFRFRQRSVFVAVNHFNSKGGDEPWHGTTQPPERHSEPQRHAMAQTHRTWVDAIQRVEPDANIVLLGDLNDFPHALTMRILLRDRGLHNPMLELPEERRHGYVYDGASQILDHILVNRGLAHRARHHIVRVNSEFPAAVSDHDPQVVRFLPLTGDETADRADDERYYDGAEPRTDAELDALIPDPVVDGEPGRSWLRPAVLGGTALAAGFVIWRLVRRRGLKWLRRRKGDGGR